MCDKIDLSNVSICDLHKEAFHRFKQKDGCYDVSLKDSETITITGPAYILVASVHNQRKS